MNELAGGILFLAWAGLIILGMVPSLGARVGMWLRSPRTAPPPPVPRKRAEEERGLEGKNLNIWV